MAGSYAGVNKAKITNRSTCGGDKKAGLVSTATGQSGYTRVQLNMKSKNCPCSYSNFLGKPCTGILTKNKVVGLTTRIGGITRM